MTTSELQVEGMSCSHCTRAVETALRGVGGVTDASVDLGKKLAVVTFDPGQATLAQLRAAVEEAGYQAVAL